MPEPKAATPQNVAAMLGLEPKQPDTAEASVGSDQVASDATDADKARANVELVERLHRPRPGEQEVKAEDNDASERVNPGELAALVRLEAKRRASLANIFGGDEFGGGSS